MRIAEHIVSRVTFHDFKELKSHRNEHAVRGRPTRKEVQHFRNGSVRIPYEGSIYERTFMSEPIENLVILNELSNLNIDKKHLQKRHLFLDVIMNQAVFQYELYKVCETRAERLENLFSNVFVQVHLSLKGRILIVTQPKSSKYLPPPPALCT